MTLINNFDSLQNAPNAGGAPWFQVVRPEDVATIPDVILDQITTAITLNGGATAYNMKATVGSVQWQETPQQVNGRLQYKSVFSFVIPKDRADVLNYAKHLNNRGVVAIVRDANGQSRLMGTKEEPAEFKLSTRTLGTTSGQRNEHRYEIALTSGKPVPFYQVTTHLPAPANVCPLTSVGVTVYEDAGLTTPTTSFDFGDTVYVNATPTDHTPTTYDFWLPQNSGKHKLISQAGATYTWVVDFVGTDDIYVGSHDGTNSAYLASGGLSVTAAGFLLDGLVCKPIIACAFRELSTAFAGQPIITVRRSSGSPTTSDFKYLSIIDGTLEAWVGAGNDGFVTQRYDQTGGGRHQFQTTAGYQPKIVDAGTLVVDSNGNPTAKVVSPSTGLECYGFGTCTDGTVYATAKITGGNASGRYGNIIGRGNNPAAGRYDDAGTDTNSLAIGAGTPTAKVNGAAVSPSQRGAFGTALVGNECVITVDAIDWTGNIATWASTKIEFLEYADVDSLVGDFIAYNDNGTDDQAYIEAELNSFYGYF